jgi:LysM repeat protein
MAQPYTVKSGDTLGAIAKKLGTSVDNLTGYKSGNANLIFPGETISVKAPVNNEATDRASTVRSELTDAPSTTTKPDSSFGGFDFSTLQNDLKETQKQKEEAFKKLDGFQSKRYEELVSERKLDDNKSFISDLDAQITQKKNERDQALAKIRSNPGASASTLAGEGKVASDLLNNEINNLIGQRNAKANEYNSALAEIESIVGREAGDLQSAFGFYESAEKQANDLIASYQKALIDQLTREEDRQFSLDDDLRDFEQALEIARIKQASSGSGTNYTILTDQFGRPTVAIDKNNPTQQRS